MNLHEDQRARFNARTALICKRARQCPVEFTRWVSRVEKGAAIEVAATHVKWHQHLDEHDRVVLFAPVGHGKSNQITRWRVLWEIGRNPDIRIAICSATKELPAKVLNDIRKDIDGEGPGSQWLRMIFPHLARINWQVWADDRISLVRQGNPTIATYSPGTQILGSRLDLIIADDLHDIKNTLTPLNREKVHRWFRTEVLSRDSPSGTRVWVLGHVWHEDDALHRLVREQEFKKFKYSCYVENEVSGAREPLIPEIWTLEKLALREKNLGPVSAKLMLFNELVDSGTGRIKREYFFECLRRGSTLGAKFATFWNPGDAPTVTGVDLGFGGGSLTCLFTVAVLPDMSLRVLDVRSGDWTGPQKIEQMEYVHQAFGSILCVESNGAQKMLEEFTTDMTALPIKGHHTGLNKHDMDFGVDSLATELANRKWIIPCDDELRPNNEIAFWINEAVAYSRDTHAGDRLMASWIAREGVRLSGFRRRASDRRDLIVDADTLVR
ncbi:MAG: hypothetical protein COA94_09125 [Rickettsiales bacterium]|nr:MAG: hypothetical protein COA94_09125 [Rickettsiales bacterium]